MTERRRREYQYTVGQEVLIKTISPNKLEPQAHGPYVIQQVYQNSTIDLKRSPTVTERVNI